MGELRQREPRLKSEKIRKDAMGQACQSCGAQDGSVVNAHCNDSEHKGMGVKADDSLTAWLCDLCHAIVDGRAGSASREERHAMWDRAFKRTVRQRFRLGLWKVAA